MADNQQHNDDGIVHYEGGIPVFNTRLDKLEKEARESKDRDDEYKKKQLQLNNRLVWFTGVLAAVGIIGGAISAYQTHISGINAAAAQANAAAAEGMVEEMKKSGNDTHELAVQAKNQADRVADQLPELRKSARAAESGAATARDALHVSERAYLIDVYPHVEYIRRIVTVNIANIGRIPSGTVEVIAHAFVIHLEDIAQPKFTLNDAIERRWARHHIVSIAPGVPYAVDQGLKQMDGAEITTGHQQVIFVGSVEYNDGFPNTPTQREFFCVDVHLSLTQNQVIPDSCDPYRYLMGAEQADGFPNNEEIH